MTTAALSQLFVRLWSGPEPPMDFCFLSLLVFFFCFLGLNPGLIIGKRSVISVLFYSLKELGLVNKDTYNTVK